MNTDNARKRLRRSMEIDCPQCSAKFFAKKTTIAKAKREDRPLFCGHICRALAKGDLIKGHCNACKQEITRQKSQYSESGAMYCSRSCSAIVNNALYVKRLKDPDSIDKQVASEVKKAQRLKDKLDPELVAARREDYLHKMREAVKRCRQDKCECGGLKIKESARCRACTASKKESFTKAMPAAVFRGKESVAGKHPSWRNSHIRNQCRAWNKELAKLPCQKCGYSLHVELCHIIPVSSFSDDAKLVEINHPDNILVLCNRDHWEFDNGHLALDDIPMRDGQTSRTKYVYKKK